LPPDGSPLGSFLDTNVGATYIVSDGSPATSRILIVDDDEEMRHMISEYLEKQGLATAKAAGRAELMAQLAKAPVALILLDLRLGNDDGLDVLRDLRGRGDTPVIIITGHRRDEVDRVVGLELGADDYLTKPFSLRELLARIRTVIRRTEQAAERQEREPASRRLQFDGWVFDQRKRRLTNPDGNLVTLTKGEYALLSAFVDAPGRPLDREFLLRASRLHEDIFDRSIDVQILRLRRKLEKCPSQPRLIKTERGFGYTFTAQVKMV
jgi:two-component system, OmpR family, response regulator